jgi:hypothetical protein
MAGVYKKQGKYDEALELHQKALDIDLVALGPDHPRTNRTQEDILLCKKNMESS